jgi:hypothetical protein
MTKVYPIISLSLVLMGPLIAGLFRSSRGLIFHIFFIFLFQGMGSLLLHISFGLFNQHSIWAWIVLYLSFNFYIGSLIFIFFAKRDIKGTSSLVMEDILNQDTSESIVLKKRNLFWPIILFPYSQGSHSHSWYFTGRRFIKDCKFGVGFTKVYLTTKRILVQLLFPKVLIVDILLSDVIKVKYFDEKKDIIEIAYKNSKISPMTKLYAFSGAPIAVSDKILLNLGKDCSIWMNKLGMISK